MIDVASIKLRAGKAKVHSENVSSEKK